MSESVQSVPTTSSRPCAIRPRYRRIVLRPIIDAVGAWAVFMAMGAFLTCAPLTAATSPAAFVDLRQNSLAIPAVANQTVDTPSVNLAAARAETPADAARNHHSPGAFLLLSAAFSLLAAINLMFFRHLRRAYAAPRRRSKLRE